MERPWLLQLVFIPTPGIGREVRIAYVLKKEDLIKSVAILKDAISFITQDKRTYSLYINNEAAHENAQRHRQLSCHGRRC
jgi:hypothetical protein